MTFEGGCTCGAVRYSSTGRCVTSSSATASPASRRSASPWAATAARRRDLALHEGEGLRWRRAPASDNDASRGRCYRCGTVVFWDAPGRETISFGIDTLDDPPPLVIGGHIWVEQDPGWEPDEEELELAIPLFRRGAPNGVRAPALRWVD